MSHHLDIENPRVDITDFYAFPGEDNSTVLAMNVNPDPGDDEQHEQGFHPEGLYKLNIDTDGDYRQDTGFGWTFGSYEEGEPQDFAVRKFTYDHKNKNPDSEEIISGKTGEVIVADDGTKYFAGRAKDPFVIAGPVIAAARESINTGQPLDLEGFNPDDAENLFAGYNVHSIVMEIPDSVLAVKSIGTWGTVDLAHGGEWHRVQRAAKPLINTLFDFKAEKHKADYNATLPHQDERLYGRIIKALTAQAVEVNETALNPERHAERIVKLLTPDVLEYNVGTKASFAGGNGRNLTDLDAENMVNLVLNTQISMGLTSPGQSDEFPYVKRIV